jgi:hypothetical protein
MALEGIVEMKKNPMARSFQKFPKVLKSPRTREWNDKGGYIQKWTFANFMAGPTF